MISGVIFDMDGLMLDTEKLLVKFWCQAAAEHGFDMKKEHVLEIRSLSRIYAVPHLKKIFGESFDFESIRARRIELMNDYIDKNGFEIRKEEVKALDHVSFEIKKGLFELLKYLKFNQFKIAVATATDYERTKLYLNKINALSYFDKIVCGNMVKRGKPDPDIYLEASKQLQLSPDECIALEDSPNGIKSAYSAGCHVIMIPDLSLPDSSLEKKLMTVCKSLDEVIVVLEKEKV